MKKIVLMCSMLIGCATKGPRAVVDPSAASKPDWASSSKIAWVDADHVVFRGQYTIRGDERVNGCFQLARIDAKEALLREIAEDLRGQIDSAQEGLSESAELALTKVGSSEFSGKVTGMRFVEQYNERYVTNGVERVDCFVLSEIRKTDYDSVKRQVLYKVAEADPEVKKAIRERAIKFFSDEKKADVPLKKSEAITEKPAVAETAQRVPSALEKAE